MFCGFNWGETVNHTNYDYDCSVFSDYNRDFDCSVISRLWNVKFLCASTHNSKRLCPLVGWSVGLWRLSVGNRQSTRRTYWPSQCVRNERYWYFLNTLMEDYLIALLMYTRWNKVTGWQSASSVELSTTAFHTRARDNLCQILKLWSLTFQPERNSITMRSVFVASQGHCFSRTKTNF